MVWNMVEHLCVAVALLYIPGSCDFLCFIFCTWWINNFQLHTNFNTRNTYNCDRQQEKEDKGNFFTVTCL